MLTKYEVEEEKESKATMGTSYASVIIDEGRPILQWSPAISYDVSGFILDSLPF